MRRIAAIMMLAVVAVAGTPAAEDPGVCLTDDEAELLRLVNDYRADNSLSPIPWSKSLSEVGQWHVWDLVTNEPVGGSCNAHSWSDYGETAPDVYWTAVCYTSDHANASGMWDKPSEITGNVYWKSGFEIAAWSSGSHISPAVALEVWQDSSPHNDVILNQGIWATNTHNPWAAMGVGMLDNYAVVWFGDLTDPAGTIAACSEVFSDDFESGNTDDWSTTVP
jgi:hypothetical protein